MMWWVVVSCIAIIVAVTHASVTGGGFMGAACTIIWIHTGCGLASAAKKRSDYYKLTYKMDYLSIISINNFLSNHDTCISLHT